MKSLLIVPVVISWLVVTVVNCQLNSEDYAQVNCQYHWGGTVCDCENLKYLMRLPSLDGNIRHIHVKNCQSFLVSSNALIDCDQLNGMKFENIGELDFMEYSFNSTRTRPSTRLEIINSTVPNFPSHLIKGNLEELIITDSIISKIHVFAFTGLFSEIATIRIKNTQVGEVESQAFRKLSIRNLEIIDSSFQYNLESRTFYDCLAQTVVIEGSNFTLLHPSTFDIKEVQQLRIFNNIFGVIEGEAFVMDVSDRAIFSNNTVNMLNHGAFQGITMNPKVTSLRTQGVYFEFNNNHVDFVEPEQELSFCPALKLQMSKFYLRDPRSCEAIGRLHEQKFFNDNSNTIFMRTHEKLEDFESISFLNDRCRSDSNWFMILLIILAVVVLLLILIPAIYCFLRNKKQLDIIMPEPRTYRQTQIVMQVETHGLMKTDF